MNKRFLFLGILASAVTSIGFVGIFLYFIYSSQVRSINEISLNIHSSYLQEIIYNYKNELVSGNYRSFRNQIASMIDRKIFTSYRVTQGDRVLDSSEDFDSEALNLNYSRIVVPIWFDEAKVRLWGQVELLVNIDSQAGLLNIFSGKLGLFLFLILIVAIILIALYSFVWQRLNISLITMVNNIFEGSSEVRKNLNSLLWAPMLSQLCKLKETNDSLAKAEQENKIQMLMVAVSHQVAHDIRSPLSALNVMLGKLIEVPEEKLNLLRGVASRINDIANDLLMRGKKIALPINELIPVSTFVEEFTFVPDLIEMIVLEKKAQFSHLDQLTIEADFAEARSSFVKGKQSDLMRVLSNLINNSAEAFEAGIGHISIRATPFSDYLMIVVHDNGKGIPDQILSKLGNSSISYGKESSFSAGNGLGLFHAAQTIRSLGGQINIRSIENSGTMIEIKIPIFEAPSLLAN